MAKKRSKARRRAMRITTIDLKRVLASQSDAKLKSALKTASRKRVAIIVLNAPFKRSAAEAAS